MKLQNAVMMISAAALVAGAAACNRSDDSGCVAGTGGDLTLVVFPQHHGKPIPNKANYLDTVFVKFNTQDAPSDGVYDKYFVGEAGEDHIHLTGLKCGNYYLFGTGYDTTINQRVKGGIPYTTEQSSGEVDLNLPVTEDH